MQIAEKILKSGVTTSKLFNDKLTELIASEGLTKVIETGTYHGTGTTKAVLDGMKGHGQPFEFYSIECNPDHYAIAKRNLGTVVGLNLVNGLSISKKALPLKVEFTDYPDYIVVDYIEAVREKSYL